jgi:hypothetical protein
MCTFVSADGAISVIAGPISGGEEAAVAGLYSQYSDLEPISGEDHAYAAHSLGQVWLFTDDQIILVGSSTLDDATALEIARAYAD